MVQETGNRLITAFQKQTEKIIYFCSAENISANLSVHEFRKSFKRMRGLLHFYDDQSDDFVFECRAKIKEFSAFLSPIRESFVNIQLFDRIIAGNQLVSERKIKAARDILVEKNKERIEGRFQAQNLCNEIHDFVRIIDDRINRFGIGRPSVVQLKEQVCKSFLMSYDLYQKIDAGSDISELHELRKKLKRLWYQLDFLKFMHPRYFRMKSDQLNKITEQLGESNDLTGFMNEMQSAGIDFDDEERQIIINLIEHQQELTQLKLMPWLKQFFNESPAVFDQKMVKIFKLS
ncbi:MAG: CHAD domain-containing protein [Prolixibacteraceae bacterium]|nr:CHAD domain-containing protein [Prolixibacteraceae bacterium]